MGGALFETHVLAQILKAFIHRAREMQIYFWRTRDGQEIDFLVETNGKLYPVEVKLGSPRYDRLAPLEKLAEPSWQEGQVVSLGATASVRISDLWTLRTPTELDLGLQSARNAHSDIP